MLQTGNLGFTSQGSNPLSLPVLSLGSHTFFSGSTQLSPLVFSVGEGVGSGVDPQAVIQIAIKRIVLIL